MAAGCVGSNPSDAASPPLDTSVPTTRHGGGGTPPRFPPRLPLPCPLLLRRVPGPPAGGSDAHSRGAGSAGGGGGPSRLGVRGSPRQHESPPRERAAPPCLTSPWPLTVWMATADTGGRGGGEWVAQGCERQRQSFITGGGSGTPGPANPGTEGGRLTGRAVRAPGRSVPPPPPPNPHGWHGGVPPLVAVPVVLCARPAGNGATDWRWLPGPLDPVTPPRRRDTPRWRGARTAGAGAGDGGGLEKRPRSRPFGRETAPAHNHQRRCGDTLTVRLQPIEDTGRTALTAHPPASGMASPLPAA